MSVDTPASKETSNLPDEPQAAEWQNRQAAVRSASWERSHCFPSYISQNAFSDGLRQVLGNFRKVFGMPLLRAGKNEPMAL